MIAAEIMLTRLVLTVRIPHLISLIVEYAEHVYALITDAFFFILPIVGLASSAIIVYRFISRPKVVVEMEWDKARVYHGAINIVPILQIRNKGGASAKDTYINLKTDSWRFYDSDDEMAETEDEHNETNWTEVDLTTNLDVDFKMTPSLGTDRTDYHLFVNSPIYKGSDFRAFLGNAAFEKNRTYELEYTVACQRQEPKTGQIEIRTTKNGASVENNPYSLWPDIQLQPLTRLKNIYQDDPYLEILSHEIEDDGEKVICSVTVRYSGEERIAAGNISLDVYDGEISSDHWLSSCTYPCRLMDPNEIYDIRFVLDLEDRDLTDVEYELSTEIVDSHRRELRGVTYEVAESNLPTDSDDAGIPLPYLDIQVANQNSITSCHVWVHVKFYDEGGRVIDVFRQKIGLEPNSRESVPVNKLQYHDVIHKIDDWDIILTGETIVEKEYRP